MPISLFIPLALAVFVGSSFFGVGIWEGLEQNVVYPAPYEHDLRTCLLVEARALNDKNEVKIEENICFRTYPHLN